VDGSGQDHRSGSPSGDDRVMEMLSIVAHELHNSLAVAQGYATILNESLAREAGSAGSEDRDEQLASWADTAERVQRSVEFLALLIDRLRDGWSADQGFTLEREPTDLAVLVEETAHHMATVFDPDDRLVVDISTPSLPVTVDPARIRQVLFNLLSNAFRYTPADAPIVVTLDSDDDMVTIEVRDHGLGVAREDAERIFEKFARVDDTAGGGLGIGLWLSRQIARAHGGDLIMAPSDEEGSRFVLSLPHENAERLEPRPDESSPEG
jgi:signal transduction histidine kinase